MEFRKFASLDNTHNDKVINHARMMGIKSPWWVGEKLDGANFSTWVSKDETKFASRNQWVDDTFFGANVVINEMARKAEELFSTLENIELLVIYGELFGHGIQNRVVYGPKQFSAFEVVIDGRVAPFVEMECLLDSVGIPIVPIIGIGYTLEEALDINETFKSTMTPRGHEGENIGEGITIAPMHPDWFGNGGRVWFKKKTSAFSENKKSGKRDKVDVTLSEDENIVVDSFLEYINENRVYSAISKFGDVTNKDFGKILGMVMNDVFDDYKKNTGVSVVHIKSNYENWGKMSKVLTSNATVVVREVFVKHL